MKKDRNKKLAPRCSRRQAWTTAVHESGHAVSCIALGGAVVEALSRADGSGLCRMATRFGDARDSRVDFAGELAAELVTRRPGSKRPDCAPRFYEPFVPPSEGAKCDAVNLLAREASLPPERVEAVLDSGTYPAMDKGTAQAIYRDTMRLLLGHWDSVLSIARELYQHGHLDADQIAEACTT